MLACSGPFVWVDNGGTRSTFGWNPCLLCRSWDITWPTRSATSDWSIHLATFFLCVVVPRAEPDRLIGKGGTKWKATGDHTAYQDRGTLLPHANHLHYFFDIKIFISIAIFFIRKRTLPRWAASWIPFVIKKKRSRSRKLRNKVNGAWLHLL